MSLYSRIVPYITLGYPDMETTNQFIQLCYRLGIKTIEIGVPFSDPMADGPVIQSAGDYARKKGIHFGSLEDLVIQPDKADHYIMTYANLFLHRGPEKTFTWLQSMGYQGAIIPDANFGVDSALTVDKKKDFALVSFISTTTDDHRIIEIARQAQGFIYAVSSPNVTGKSVDTFDAIESKITLAKQHTRTPINIGFGIKDAAAVRRALNVADGAIIGTALIQCINADASTSQNLKAMEDYLITLSDS
ncbi:tryptophan synthase subunit alpha [Desulfurispira natronophila]|uniref:Tryptophan synthase alpha chain n=1 Tax=Desulfurispira natronophila TaxID=682562 RepID=A0A7W7Y361_9BACT|nr:tryptophan synthase subunit alpha [Desulfurispira natronophila]MBB5020952.1 tryptophan synthase alpha chain [Desulfurispira natronophila]